MAKSDGSATNHDVFWEAFTKATGLDAEEMETLFPRFYEGQFSQVGEGVQANPEAARAVATLKGKGYRGCDHHAHVPTCGPCMSAFAGRALTPTISNSPPITRPAMP